MELIGDHLKKIRKKKNINVKSIAEDLKISEDIIKKIESNEFSGNINRTYLIGYLRSYANFLKLDANKKPIRR